jgi:predicted transcriptional regulator
MLPSKGRRSTVEIIADILRLLRLGRTGRTQIGYIAKLSRDQVLKYLQKLLESGVIEDAGEEMGLPSYRITKKGLTFLGVIENLREMLPTDGKVDILHRSKIVGINIGQVLVTRGVSQQSAEKPEFATFIRESLERYRQGDWGDMSDADKLLNEQSLEKNLRLFSSYESRGFPEIWITTEPDRSYTTIMFPSEQASALPLERYTPTTRVESGEVKKA